MQENPTSNNRLEELAIEFVQRRDWTTMVELQQHMSDYMEARGDMVWEIAPGVVLWAGMSEEFANLVMGLIEKKRIFLHPTIPLTYFVDGCTLRLPVAKRPPKDGYKKDHWLPVCLRTVPPKKKQGR